MIPPIEEIKAVIERGVSGATVTVEGTHLLIEPKDLVRVCQALKSSDWQFDHVAGVTAVDYPPDQPAQGTAGLAGRIEMVYHLGSMAKKLEPITLRSKLPRANPVIASLTPMYRGAEFQEREVYDLYGVRFDGHPDLRRILMWDGFNGHPMRKDYVPEDQDAPER